MNAPELKNRILREIIITIDGPAGSGKTTTAREVARELGLRHVDTGAMYRTVTLLALKAGTDLDDGEAIAALTKVADIDFVEGAGAKPRIIVEGEDVTDIIRSPEVTEHVSRVSALGDVRRAMVRKQRQLAENGGVCLEGRDIGSVVLPGAHVKVYLDASADVRARRRFKELEERGIQKDLATVRQEIEDRDNKDRTREISPLRIPLGARVVDTTGMTVDDQVGEVIAIAKRVLDRLTSLVHTRGRNPYKRRGAFYRVCQYFVRGILKVVWGGRVIQKETLDYVEGFIFACNHRSNADPPVVGSSLDREVAFVAKEALFRTRWFGRLISSLGAIPIRRGMFDRVAMDRFIELLENGKSVLIFPEGGRMPGETLGEGKGGVGYLALKSGRAVIPAYLEGTERLRSSLLRKPRLTLVLGRPIRLTDDDLSRYQATDYREYSKMVMYAIEALRDEFHAG